MGDGRCICHTQLLDGCIAAEILLAVRKVVHKGMLHDDSREAGQNAPADNSVIICQTLVRIESIVLAGPDLEAQILKAQLGKLVQNRIGKRPALGFQIRPVITRSHKDQRTADGILVVIRGIDMLAHKNRRIFLGRIVHTVFEGKGGIAGSRQINRHTCIFFQFLCGIF